MIMSVGLSLKIATDKKVSWVKVRAARRPAVLENEVIKRDKNRCRERDRERDNERDREIDRDIDRDTDRDRDSDRDRSRLMMCWAVSCSSMRVR